MKPTSDAVEVGNGTDRRLARWLLQVRRDGGYGHVLRRWHPRTVGELRSLLDEVLLIDGVDGDTKLPLRLNRLSSSTAWRARSIRAD